MLLLLTTMTFHLSYHLLTLFLTPNLFPKLLLIKVWQVWELLIFWHYLWQNVSTNFQV